MSKLTLATTTMLTGLLIATSASAENYGPYPVTLKGYTGDKKNTVSYSGQIARHVLHDSMKKLAKKGDGGKNAASVEAQLLKYFNGKDPKLPIIAPKDKDGIDIKQSTMGELSGGANLAGKFYNGPMPAWPGAKSGKDAIMSMIKHAAKSNKGFDAKNGYDWSQLISKYTMGAVSYNQAVDNYLDEKMQAGNKPNSKPYKKGAHYTGKEHSWDEAFGYWGAAAHSFKLSPSENYAVAKLKDAKLSDANGDGKIDLKSEHVFGPAYYAAAADKSGKTKYTETIFKAFLDGRKLITSAKGEDLSAAQLAKIQGYVATISSNWEKVLAEATFKYAGSVYKDINKLKSAKGDDAKKAYRKYVKHWGELKGFAMALQTGKSNLGETATKLNKLIGYGPVTMDKSYVTGVDAKGNFVRDRKRGWNEYQLHMLKIQKLLVDKFGVVARPNDQLAALEGLSSKLEADANAESD